MKTISDSAESTAKPTKAQLDTFSTTLSDGRTVTIREMTGRDLIFMEKDLSKCGDIEKGMKVIEKLIVGSEKITYEEILDLGAKDFRKLADLIGQANGLDENENYPN